MNKNSRKRLMKRRSLLAAGGTAIATLAGCTSTPNPSEVLESPEKGDKLGEKSFTNAFITLIEFYQGGYADVTLQESHDMNRIGITHSARSFGTTTEPLKDAYKVWDLPEFSGPETYQISQPITSNNDSYPSNIFKFRVAPSKDEIFIGYGTDLTVSTPIPQSFVPGDTPIQDSL
jgi:hypothetical protein